MNRRFVYKGLVNGDCWSGFAFCINASFLFLLESVTLGFLLGESVSFGFLGDPPLFLSDTLM